MYTGTLMTETVFYPLFVCVALALVLALERPTIQRQLVLLGLCVLAFLTRSQAIVLLPAVATAPLLLAWLDRRRLRMLADFRVLYGVLAAGVVGVLAVQLARGHSPYDVLGSYSVTGHATYRPDQVLKWLLYHVAELDLYLGIVPFAALLLLTFVGRSLDRPLRVFLAAALPLTAWLLLEVGAFASALSPRIQERNLFYVAPLFLIALLAWIQRGMPRPPRAAAVAAVLAAALPGALPYHSLIDVPAQWDTLALLPLWWLQETVVRADTIPIVVVAAAAAIGLLFLSISPRYALVLPAVVLLWFAFATERIQRFDHGFPRASVGALYQGITAPRRDWVDAVVGRNADVAFVFSGNRRPPPDLRPRRCVGSRSRSRRRGVLCGVVRPLLGTGLQLLPALTGSPDDAADATQEAFINVLRRLQDDDRPVLDFASYLYAAARNESYALMRRRSRAVPPRTRPCWPPRRRLPRRPTWRPILSVRPCCTTPRSRCGRRTTSSRRATARCSRCARSPGAPTRRSARSWGSPRTRLRSSSGGHAGSSARP